MFVGHCTVQNVCGVRECKLIMYFCLLIYFDYFDGPSALAACRSVSFHGGIFKVEQTTFFWSLAVSSLKHTRFAMTFLELPS